MDIATALMNTLLGMGVVFCVLIFISFIIYLLGFVPKMIDAICNKGKAEPIAESVPVATSATVASAPVREEDTELTAVIAAAVAAAMSETLSQPVAADGLVIRSIKRRR